MKKTNVMRLLDGENVAYEAREYEIEDGLNDGIHVAEKVGLSYEMVFKTLVCQGEGDYMVFIIPVVDHLDLKKGAKAAGVKKLEMIPMDTLKDVTGYVHGGCSPLGMKKLFPTFIHESARDLDKMAVSAGKLGAQVLLAPADLLKLTKGEMVDLIEREA